ncbi:MAG TPA: hypothetical protein VLE48_11060 [Terriglobales bacterium]|nr:hypothetical protein [Terriglobales bacterium]
MRAMVAILLMIPSTRAASATPCEPAAADVAAVRSVITQHMWDDPAPRLD